MKMDHDGVHKRSKERKEMLEMGKKGRVIEGPWASLIRVPLRKGKGVSNCKPITVDFEICAVVSWNEEEFDACGYKGNP